MQHQPKRTSSLALKKAANAIEQANVLSVHESQMLTHPSYARASIEMTESFKSAVQRK